MSWKILVNQILKMYNFILFNILSYFLYMVKLNLLIYIRKKMGKIKGLRLYNMQILKMQE